MRKIDVDLKAAPFKRTGYSTIYLHYITFLLWHEVFILYDSSHEEYRHPVVAQRALTGLSIREGWELYRDRRHRGLPTWR